MKKEIKIVKQGDKQVGVRLPQSVYDKIVALSKQNDCSVQEIIRYILQEEISNY